MGQPQNPSEHAGRAEPSGRAPSAARRLRGQDLVAGDRTRRALARLLGVGLKGRPNPVRAVAWHDRQLILDIGWGDEPLRFTLRRREGGESGFVTTDHLVLAHDPGELDPELVRAMRKRAPFRLLPYKMEHMARLVLSDPDAGHAGEPLPGEDHAVRSAGAPHEAPHQAPPAVARHAEAGGAATRAALERLFALKPTAYAITAAAWTGSALAFEVRLRRDDDPDEAAPVILVQSHQSGAQGFVRVGDLVLSHLAVAPDARLVQLLTVAARRNLATKQLADLAQLVADDPEHGHPDLPVPSTDDHEPPASMLLDWGPTDAWADFFANAELQRAQLDSMDPMELFVFAQHSDAECNNVDPFGVAPLQSLVAYPWDDRLRRGGPPKPRFLPRQLGAMGGYSSDLSESDVILGNPDKLQRMIHYAAEEAERTGKTLFVSNTCVPIVTGEDVRSMYEHEAAQCSCASAYLTVTPQSMQGVFEPILIDLRLEAEGRVTPDPGAINLLGHATGRDLDELEALLDAAGVRLNTVLFPELSKDRIQTLPHAATHLALPNALWNHLYEQVGARSKCKLVVGTPPYGWRGTEAWLHEAGRATGREAQAAAAWEAAVAQTAPAWRRVVQEAQGVRLALVVRPFGELHHLLEPASTWGVPLVELLEEMGFGLDIFLLGRGRKRRAGRAEVERQIQELFAHPSRHALTWFRSLDELLDGLRHSDARAVFTNHSYDWRVSQAGKAAFSLQLFERGLEGAVRSAERLLNACQVPFFRRFQRHLARDAQGRFRYEVSAPAVRGSQAPTHTKTQRGPEVSL